MIENSREEYEVLATGDVIGVRWKKPLNMNNTGKFVCMHGQNVSVPNEVYQKFIGSVKVGEKVWMIDNNKKPAVENLIKFKLGSKWCKFWRMAKAEISHLNSHAKSIDELRADIQDLGDEVEYSPLVQLASVLAELIIATLRLSFKLGVNKVLDEVKSKLYG